MKKRILDLFRSNSLVIAFVFLGALSFIVPSRQEKLSSEKTPLQDPHSVDTYIPAGFVLVPLEIVNAESLSSLVGDLGGVVDLYLASGEKQLASIKVGSRLKLLRAPLNPQQYAVLVRDSESSRLLSYSGPFIAVVQNPQTEANTIPVSSQGKSIRIEYQK
ncbi:MAG: hypothetical protein AAGB31_06000 [Bdellovibrio sp.]